MAVRLNLRAFDHAKELIREAGSSWTTATTGASTSPPPPRRTSSSSSTVGASTGSGTSALTTRRTSRRRGKQVPVRGLREGPPLRRTRRRVARRPAQVLRHRGRGGASARHARGAARAQLAHRDCHSALQGPHGRRAPARRAPARVCRSRRPSLFSRRGAGCRWRSRSPARLLLAGKLLVRSGGARERRGRLPSPARATRLARG